MRRYWYSLSLLLFIFLVFVWNAASMQKSTHAVEKPFSISTQFGSEDVFAGMILETYGANGKTSTLFGDHESSLTGIRQLDSTDDPFIDGFIQEFRSFFRGKQGHSFYIDDSFIISANIPYQLFTSSQTNHLAIEWLEQDSGRTLSFSVPVNDQVYYSYITDMQVLDSKLHLVVEENHRDGIDLTLYKIDIQSRSIEEQQTLYRLPQTEDRYLYTISRETPTGMVNNTQYFSPASYLTWYVEKYHHTNAHHSNSVSQIDKLFVYSYTSEETNHLSIANQLNEREDQWYFAQQHDEHVVFMEQTSHSHVPNSSYLSVNLETLETDFHELPSQGEMDTLFFANHFIYQFISNPSDLNDLAIIRVIDPITNEFIYEGTLSSTNDSLFNDLHYFDLYYASNDSSR